MSVLVVAEHRQGEVRDTTRELVTAARELGGPVAVLVIAADPAPLASQVDLAGVDEILTVTSGSQEFETDTFQAAVESVVTARNPRVVLTGFTVDGMGWAPAVAASLGLGFASDVFAVRDDGGSVVAQRAFYGGKVHGELEFPGKATVLLMLRAATWAPAEGTGSATVSAVDVELPESRARHADYVEAPVADVDITTAEFLLSIGRGVGEKDNIEQFEELAERMGAVLSVSRPLVDAGWMPASRQVGQSGKTVKPKVYLAFGISGAVQHLAGMKAAGTIIAVNSDPEAAIFNVAHYGAVCDIFDVADELEKLYSG
jgi:electron transfer flavoprotein alpha subunit